MDKAIYSYIQLKKIKCESNYGFITSYYSMILIIHSLGCFLLVSNTYLYVIYQYCLFLHIAYQCSHLLLLIICVILTKLDLCYVNVNEALHWSYITGAAHNTAISKSLGQGGICNYSLHCMFLQMCIHFMQIHFKSIKETKRNLSKRVNVYL